MNFAFVRDEIERVIKPKYKGKKNLNADNVLADVAQVLTKMKANKQIADFDNFKVYLNHFGVMIYGNVFLPFGKIHMNIKVDL